jgi:hypothetical protein
LTYVIKNKIGAEGTCSLENARDFYDSGSCGSMGLYDATSFKKGRRSDIIEVSCWSPDMSVKAKAKNNLMRENDGVT